MTTGPRLKTDSNFLPGLIALALFVVFAAVFLTASFPDPEGFIGEGSITASIGYAMFSLDGGVHPSEGFLVSFFVISLALDAALGGALLLAKTEENGRIAGALRFSSDDDETLDRTDGSRDRARSTKDS